MRYFALILVGCLCAVNFSSGFTRKMRRFSTIESRFNMQHQLNAIALSSGGAILFECDKGAPQTINVRDLGSGRILTSQKVGFHVDFLAFDSDGRTLAAASKLEKKVSIFRFENTTLSPLYQISLRGYVALIVFSPKKSALYVASGKQKLIDEGRGEKVYIDTETISMVNIGDANHYLVREVKIDDANKYFKLMLSGDGERLFYETYQNKFKVLDSHNLLEITKVGFKKFVDIWVPSYDGKGLFFGFRQSWSNNAVVAFQKLARLERGREERMRGFWGFGRIGFLAISPNGETIFAGRRDRWVAFDVATRGRIGGKRIRNDINITNLVASTKNGNLLVVHWDDYYQKVGVSVFSFSNPRHDPNLEMCIEPELISVP